MHSCGRWLVVGLMLWSAGTSAEASAFDAPESWLGKVVYRKHDAKARIGDKDVAVEYIPFGAIVGKERGEWLWLERGWVRRSDVLNVDQLRAYGTELILKDPRSARGYRNRGTAKAALGDPEGAIKDFTEAIGLDPAYAPTFNDRGKVRLAKGDLLGAFADFDEATRLEPKNARFVNNRGLVWAAKGELDSAIMDYAQSIALDPQFVPAYRNRADVSRAAGEIQAALDDYTKAIRIAPKHSELYALRADAWRLKGDPEAALMDCESALKVNPKCAAAFAARAWLRATAEDKKFRNGPAAVKDAGEALKLMEPKDPHALEALAAAHAEAGQFGEAVKAQQQAIALIQHLEAAKKAKERLALYSGNKPYHEKVAAK